MSSVTERRGQREERESDRERRRSERVVMVEKELPRSNEKPSKRQVIAAVVVVDVIVGGGGDGVCKMCYHETCTSSGVCVCELVVPSVAEN